MEALQTPKARTFSSTVNRASVESILTRNESTAAMQPSPQEHIGSPTANRNDGHMNERGGGNEAPMSPPISQSSRSRPSSFIAGKSKANRLSLSFPVQVPTNYQTNSSSGSNSPLETSTSGTLIQSPAFKTSADPPNDFLQELARQERRVLELREELGRAEGELEGLKKKWAYREVNKKRSEIRAVEQMASYAPKTASAGEENDTNEARRSTELTMDKRKAMLLAGIGKESRRKVLEGRHTRTLSLLSPDRSNFGPTPPFSPLGPGSSTFSNTSIRPEKSPLSPDTPSVNGCVPITMGIARSATLPDLPAHLFKPRNRNSYNNNNTSSANEVLKTGKKLAEDFRTGLWTFVEDLRQATVGEEAVNEPPSNRNRNMGMNANTEYAGGVGYGALNSLAASTPKNKGSREQSGGGKSPIVERDYTKDLHELIPDESLLLSSATEQEEQRPPFLNPGTKRKSITAPREDEITADDWLNWDDSPASSKTTGSDTAEDEDSQRWSSSTFATEVDVEVMSRDETPSKVGGSGRGAGTEGQREGLQWPQLKPFSPFHLKKTAESLMREWEKSLTPPPEEEGEKEDVRNQGGRSFEGHDLLR